QASGNGGDSTPRGLPRTVRFTAGAPVQGDLKFLAGPRIAYAGRRANTCCQPPPLVDQHVSGGGTMQLNVPTLVLVDIYILALVGILMLHAWRRGRREPTLGYLSAALLLGVLGTALGNLRGMGVDYLPLVIGNVVLHISTAMIWTTMRVFAGRQPHVPGICAGAVVWAL